MLDAHDERERQRRITEGAKRRVSQPRGAGAARVRESGTTGSLFTLIRVQADHLVCETIGDEPEEVLVAKQYLLRNSITVRDGTNYTYASFVERSAIRTTVVGGVNFVVSQIEVVIPRYVLSTPQPPPPDGEDPLPPFPADRILVEKLPADQIAVEVVTGTVIIEGVQQDVVEKLEWQEVSERQWMRKADQR